MKQFEAVVEAMRQNGGYATLGHLYKTAVQIPGCVWNTRTPFASIRRIVQTHDLFFRIAPGLWGLSEQRDIIQESLNITPDSPNEKKEEFNHSYYQGLIVEIGNAQDKKTHVPPQDRNKVFLQTTLGSITTLPSLPAFTFEELLRRARTIDVSWFNTRSLPSAFFEIEHTTDINNSLLKFLEFQDFRVNMRVVAASERRAEFQHKLNSSAFSPIRNLVQFLDYSTLSDWHSKFIAAAVAKEQVGL